MRLSGGVTLMVCVLWTAIIVVLSTQPMGCRAVTTSANKAGRIQRRRSVIAMLTGDSYVAKLSRAYGPGGSAFASSKSQSSSRSGRAVSRHRYNSRSSSHRPSSYGSVTSVAALLSGFASRSFAYGSFRSGAAFSAASNFTSSDEPAILELSADDPSLLEPAGDPDPFFQDASTAKLEERRSSGILSSIEGFLFGKDSPEILAEDPAEISAITAPSVTQTLAKPTAHPKALQQETAASGNPEPDEDTVDSYQPAAKDTPPNASEPASVPTAEEPKLSTLETLGDRQEEAADVVPSGPVAMQKGNRRLQAYRSRV